MSALKRHAMACMAGAIGVGAVARGRLAQCGHFSPPIIHAAALRRCTFTPQQDLAVPYSSVNGRSPLAPISHRLKLSCCWQTVSGGPADLQRDSLAGEASTTSALPGSQFPVIPCESDKRGGPGLRLTTSRTWQPPDYQISKAATFPPICKLHPASDN